MEEIERDVAKRWNKPKNLLSCFHVPEEFKPYVRDYEINLFEIAYLSDEKLKKAYHWYAFLFYYTIAVRSN